MAKTENHSTPQRPHRTPVRWYILVFLAPATLIYTIFAIYPIFESLRLSLYQAGDKGGLFVGLGNYVRLVGEPYWAEQFWNAFKNNVLLFLMHMSVSYTHLTLPTIYSV